MFIVWYMKVLNNYFHLFSYIDEHFINLTTFCQYMKDNKIENYICYCYNYIKDSNEHNILSIDDRLITIFCNAVQEQFVLKVHDVYENKIIDNRQSCIKTEYMFIIYFQNVCIKISYPNYIYFLPNANIFGSYKINIVDNLKKILNNPCNKVLLKDMLRDKKIVIKEYIYENPLVHFYIYYNNIHYFITPIYYYSKSYKFVVYRYPYNYYTKNKIYFNNVSEIVSFLSKYIPNLQNYLIFYNKIENNTYDANILYDTGIDFNDIHIIKNIKNTYIIPIICTSFLHTIYFDNDFNEFINKDILPNNINTIVFGDSYDQITCHLPTNLKNLIFKGNVNKQVILPNNFIKVIFKKKIEM